jgi:hypothetical protein
MSSLYRLSHYSALYQPYYRYLATLNAVIDGFERMYFVAVKDFADFIVLKLRLGYPNIPHQIRFPVSCIYNEDSLSPETISPVFDIS